MGSMNFVSRLWKILFLGDLITGTSVDFKKISGLFSLRPTKMMQQTITTQVHPTAPPSYDDVMNGSNSTTIQIHPTIPIQPYMQSIPTYGTMITTSNITTQPTAEPSTHRIIIKEMIAVNACPVCRIGMLNEEFTCCGIFCAIFFFPLGVLCCLCMKDKVCTNCNARF